ncbi:MAG: hypothetical protein M3256_13535 [Actinomycetota bacterium]|nr:hypothetical protein [Actinomycetota bacterium]
MVLAGGGLVATALLMSRVLSDCWLWHWTGVVVRRYGMPSGGVMERQPMEAARMPGQPALVSAGAEGVRSA